MKNDIPFEFDFKIPLNSTYDAKGIIYNTIGIKLVYGLKLVLGSQNKTRLFHLCYKPTRKPKEVYHFLSLSDKQMIKILGESGYVKALEEIEKERILNKK